MECGESRQGRMNMKKLLLASVAALSVLSTSVAYTADESDPPLPRFRPWQQVWQCNDVRVTITGRDPFSVEYDIGGMIWGASFALLEEAITDKRSGRILNSDLAEYRVPVNADVPSLDAILVPETDPVLPLGVKGVGEIGSTGTVGAIANAVWHATGARVRRFPIRIEDLL